MHGLPPCPDQVSKRRNTANLKMETPEWSESVSIEKRPQAQISIRGIARGENRSTHNTRASDRRTVRHTHPSLGFDELSFPTAWNAILNGLISGTLVSVGGECAIDFVAVSSGNHHPVSNSDFRDAKDTVDFSDVTFDRRRKLFSQLDFPHVQCGSERAEQSASDTCNHMVKRGRIFGAS